MTRRYRVHHRTEYRYGEPVAVGHTVARLVPRAGLPHQTLISGSVTVEPTPTHSHQHVDGFGNVLTYVTVEEPHDVLAVTASSEVEVRTPPEPAPGGPWLRPWEDAVAATASDRSDGTPRGLQGRQRRVTTPRRPDGRTPSHAATRSYSSRRSLLCRPRLLG